MKRVHMLLYIQGRELHLVADMAYIDIVSG